MVGCRPQSGPDSGSTTNLCLYPHTSVYICIRLNYLLSRDSFDIVGDVVSLTRLESLVSDHPGEIDVGGLGAEGDGVGEDATAEAHARIHARRAAHFRHALELSLFPLYQRTVHQGDDGLARRLSHDRNIVPEGENGAVFEDKLDIFVCL